MRLIPKGGNDEVYTPIELCNWIIDYFKPKGKILEPCYGTGNFYQNKVFTAWNEIKMDSDFFENKDKYNWIITNPPYSQFRAFLNHSMELADNIVFLTSVNHFWLKARIRDMKEKNFWFKEIIVIDTPKTFPQSGFQIGIVHIQKDYKGDMKTSHN